VIPFDEAENLKINARNYLKRHIFKVLHLNCGISLQIIVGVRNYLNPFG